MVGSVGWLGSGVEQFELDVCDVGADVKDPGSGLGNVVPEHDDGVTVVQFAAEPALDRRLESAGMPYERVVHEDLRHGPHLLLSLFIMDGAGRPVESRVPTLATRRPDVALVEARVRTEATQKVFQPWPEQLGERPLDVLGQGVAGMRVDDGAVVIG